MCGRFQQQRGRGEAFQTNQQPKPSPPQGTQQQQHQAVVSTQTLSMINKHMDWKYLPATVTAGGS
jgi:hypothetical protein